MRKINKSHFKLNAAHKDLKKGNAKKTAIMYEDTIVQFSKKPMQNDWYTGNSDIMDAVSQTQTKGMKRSFISPETGDGLQGEEYHWMASAAYNQL
jgi:hypothetical protein